MGIGLFLKAKYRKTAYSSVYEASWYAANFLEEKQNYLIGEDGLIRTKYSRADSVFETVGELTMIKAYPSFASERGVSPNRGEGIAGSGFFISTSGILATNVHVIEGAINIEVCLFSKLGISTFKANILLSDARNDIALLQIDDEDFKSYVGLPYGFIETAEPGEKVFTIGYPLSDIMGNNYKVTDGIISSLSGIADCSKPRRST